MVEAGRIKGVDEQSYVVYVDVPHQRANIHRLVCEYVYQHGGVSHGAQPSSWYVGFFAEVEAAEYVAHRTTTYAVRRCDECIE